MRLTADDIHAAIEAAIARDDVPPWFAIGGAFGICNIDGDLNLNHVAEALSERLDNMLAGRGLPPRPASDPPIERCRICGCTETHACLITCGGASNYSERPCGWADESHTLCDNPDCIRGAERAAALPAEMAAAR